MTASTGEIVTFLLEQGADREDVNNVSDVQGVSWCSTVQSVVYDAFIHFLPYFLWLYPVYCEF